MKDQKPTFDPDERIFTLSDIKKLLRQEGKKIKKAAWIAALAAFSFFLIAISPKYKIEASFKESANKNSGDMKGLEALFGNLSSDSSDSQTIALFNSNTVLKAVIERMGVQASVPKPGLLSKVYRRVRDNFRSEWKVPLADIDWFVFRNVIYGGERKLSYSLRFEDRDHFSILSGNTIITSGLVGSPVRVPEAMLTLVRVPENLRFGRSYPLLIDSWVSSVQSIRSLLQIASVKNQKSIFEIKFSHRDRYFGKEIVNALMEEYRNYLKKDHDQLVRDQLVYLGEKQEEIYSRMSSAFDEYTEYLQSNLSQAGHLGLQQEIDGLTKDYKLIAGRVLLLDLEYQRLCRMETDPKAFSVIDEHYSSHALQELLKSISDLKQQRDLIELSLPSKGEFSEQEYAARKAELKAIRDEVDIMQQLLEGIANQTSIPSDSLFKPEKSLGSWAARLASSQEEDREDLAEYIESHIHLLAMQEKIVQEQARHGRDIPEEFKGIDLKTAQTLFISYNNKLDKTNQAKIQISRLKSEIGESDFEISSLSAVLSDPLSQKLIARASDLALQLKDEKHRSEKEKSRWVEELTLQKSVLKEHLDQLLKVEFLESSMIQDKIAALQAISLGCVSGQISVLQEQLSDWIRNKKTNLLEEKNILESKLDQMRNGFSDLPEKWRKEKLLNLKTQMGVKMVQTLTDLVESKTISSHLHHIQSKPLDLATLPSLPCCPNLLVKTFLGAFLAGFAVFFRSFSSCLLGGFPTSAEKLQAMRYPVISSISPFCDGPKVEPLVGADLEAIRQIALFLDKPPVGKIIGIIEGKGPGYSFSLAEHFARMSLRSLVIRCDFHIKFSSEDLPGLLQGWKHGAVDVPVRHEKGVDYLASGGYTPYGAEVIRSRFFHELIERQIKDYDFIFLVSRSPLHSVESLAPLDLCDKAIVTVCGEPTEQLTPFVDWAYHEGMRRLAFLTVSST